jgi:hypothetical protein
MSGWLKKVAAKIAALSKDIVTFVWQFRMLAIGHISYYFFGWIYTNSLYIPTLIVYCGAIKGTLIALLISIFFNMPSSVQARVATIGIGTLADRIFTFVFNWVIYPAVIYRYGAFYGFLVITSLSAFVCCGYIVFYDWLKKDWLGIETIKELREYGGKNRIANLLATSLQKSKIFAFFFLSIKFDPFYTVVYMRHGAHKYNGMAQRDWNIFWASLIVGDIFWTAVFSLGFYLLPVAESVGRFLLNLASQSISFH